MNQACKPLEFIREVREPETSFAEAPGGLREITVSPADGPPDGKDQAVDTRSSHQKKPASSADNQNVPDIHLSGRQHDLRKQTTVRLPRRTILEPDPSKLKTVTSGDRSAVSSKLNRAVAWHPSGPPSRRQRSLAGASGAASHESSEQLRPRCKIKRANIPELQEGIETSEAFRFHGFDSSSFRDGKLAVGSNLKLEADGGRKEMRTTMLVDLSKKQRVQEAIRKHQRLRTLQNHRREILARKDQRTPKQGGARPMRRVVERARTTAETIKPQRMLLARAEEAGALANAGRESPEGQAEGEAAEEEQDLAELEAGYKQIEMELFKNQQVHQVARQRYRNSMRYRYQTGMAGLTMSPRSKEQIKQQIRNEIRDGILRHKILEPEQLPEKFEK